MATQIGALHVRRSIFIEATPKRVWQEFTSFERIKAWFGLGHTLHALDPTEGAVADLSVEIDGQRRHFGGAVLSVDPARELTIASNWQGAEAWPTPTYWTIRLTALYGGTLVELFHHGFERLGGDAGDNLEGYEQGWDVKHLVALRRIVLGKSVG
ncbi:MAG: SRPBCC domain-containing protein [Gammaproteobacteria bacterium]|nr:SRPBCC domain-containing protein [Gammaproteobacteria bacterium]